jgi:diguanylate cyclase (GGDEF)-like protein
MKTIVTSNPKECIGILEEQDIDLVLIDFAMPHCSGKELATIIRQYPQYVGLPIVFMSAMEDIEATLINTGLGIDDFLVKPFTPQQLVSVVSSRARRAAELRSLMVRDGFTGLINHARFLEILGNTLADVARNETPTSFVMIDIDHFKKINDTYGHAAGDQVIKSLSRMLQQQLRRSDILGRCGGEEFGIIMPNCDLQNAQRIMERLRTIFSEAYYTVGKHRINVTFSAGLMQIKPGDNLDQVINTVDAALYEAKQMGRNRVIAAT